MKLSELSKRNIESILTIVDQQALSETQMQTARAAIEKQLEFDAYEYHQELQDIQHRANLVLTEKFMDTQEEQLHHHLQEHRRIFDDIQQKTWQSLESLQNNSEIQHEKVMRDLAIQKHMLMQKEILLQARLEKERLDKQLVETKQVIHDLSKKYDSMLGNRAAAQKEVQAARAEAKTYLPKFESTVETLKKHYRSVADPFADFKSSPYAHAAQHALDRDRTFQNKMDGLQDAARRAIDPDVRNRIELEIDRQRGSYGVHQNTNIEALTGRSRSDVIRNYQAMETKSALAAAELDQKLAYKGIRIDFTKDFPEVQQTSLDTTPQQLKDMWDAFSKEGQLSQHLEKTEGDLATIDEKINNTEIQLDSEHDIANRLILESKAKSKLLQRLEENLKTAREGNSSRLSEDMDVYRMSDRVNQLLKEARERLLEQESQAQLQHRPSEELNHGIR